MLIFSQPMTIDDGPIKICQQYTQIKFGKCQGFLLNIRLLKQTIFMVQKWMNLINRPISFQIMTFHSDFMWFQ